MIIFDDNLGQLAPMTDLRASFEVRTGMLTTAGRIAAHKPKSLAGYWVAENMKDMVAERANAPVNHLPNEEIVYCINGRWAMPDPKLKLEVGQAVIEKASGHVVAAMLRRADAQYFLETNQLHERVSIEELDERLLYKYPWDVLTILNEAITYDISLVRMLDAVVPSEKAIIIGQHPVEVHVESKIYPNVVLDAEQGPIAINERAVIRPNAVICGPCSIGRGSTIADGALIKSNTVIGPMCKVGGEVGGTIFQGYSNKGHHGFLGDSWVGKWVNFGAGTTNSNLLNTYGEVVMRLSPKGRMHKTGMTFLGAFVGDHVKFAINTRLMTGTVIGTGSMIATTAAPPGAVNRFAWLTDRGEQTFRFEKFLETAKAMMKRRDREPSEAYIKVMRDLHDQHRS